MLVRMLATTWLVPPALNIALVLCGLLLMRMYRRLGLALTIVGVVSLWLLSTLVVSSHLAVSIQKHPATSADIIARNDSRAIIVLGASHLDNAAEYGVSTPTQVALARLHYAAHLHNQTGLPIMLTGGRMNRLEVHADVMGESLQNQFGIAAKWYERKSSTTWQNALFTAEILHPVGNSNIVVVTHAYHMQRAVNLFELAGFNVTPAPTQLSRVFPWQEWRYWLPDATALDLSAKVMHEYLGLLWYRLFTPVDSSFERDVQIYGQ